VSRVIVQLSDLHLPGEGDLFGHIDTAARLTAALDLLVRSRWRPELLLVTGDLADHGAAESYRRVRPLLDGAAATLGARLLCIPGNHDGVENFERGMLDREPSGAALDQVVRLGGLRVLALDSTSRGGHHGSLEDEQLSALAAELAEPAPEGTLLALHHPPVPSPLGAMRGIVLRDPERLAAVVSGSDVRMILCGHCHHVGAAQFAGVPVWMAPAVAYTLDNLAGTTQVRGVAEGGLTLLQVHEDTIVATHRPFTTTHDEYVIDSELSDELAKYPGD
jgi:3',5'-cyclic AMP phosphodiesterase CpdA